MIDVSPDQIKQPIKRLILLRKYFDITQTEMASICKISNRTYQRIEYEETDMTVTILLKVSHYFNIDPTYFFRANIYSENKNITPDINHFENKSTMEGELFKKIINSIEYFINNHHQTDSRHVSQIRLNEVLYSKDAMTELNIEQNKFTLKDHTKLKDEEIKLGLEFMLQHTNKVVINFCNHYFGHHGQIESINVVKCSEKNLEDPRFLLIPHRVSHLVTQSTEIVEDIFKGLKFLYNDNLLLLQLNKN